ncbi:MAG: TraR/DksA family transcriptional regulator [Candidatus Methylomirabilia bacterium]
MEQIQAQLERELRQARERLRQLGGTVVVEDIPTAVGDFSSFTDSLDHVQLNEAREIGFATRSLLVERANRLADALDRLRNGLYGVCEECEEPIAPARLRAIPEVTTCVRCQDRLEREARHAVTVDSLFGGPEEDEAPE